MQVRLDKDLLLIRVDWAKIITDKAKQVSDFIIVRYEWNKRAAQFDMKVHHYLSAKKDSDVALSAVKSLVSTLRQQGRSIKRVVIISDGGPSDFHMKKWVYYEFEIADRLKFDLEHLVMAPHHGDGPCDSAKSQAAKVLQNKLLNQPLPVVSLQYICDTFNTIHNHSAKVFQLREVTAYREPDEMIHIRECHRYVADADTRKIYGYVQSLHDPTEVQTHDWHM